MKNILQAIWLPLGLLTCITSSTLLLIINRDSNSPLLNTVLFLTAVTTTLYFLILLFRALSTFIDSEKLRKVLNKIDPTQQVMINDQRRKEHRAALSHKATHKELHFFGDTLQCSIYAPDYKRAKNLYNQLPKHLQNSGGKFYYNKKGILTIDSHE